MEEQLILFNITFNQWKDKTNKAYEAARRIDRMIVERARKVSREAGLDPQLLGIHPHNAMCAYNSGSPWTNVDYSKCRKVIWLLKQQHKAYDIVERLSKRLWSKVLI